MAKQDRDILARIGATLIQIQRTEWTIVVPKTARPSKDLFAPDGRRPPLGRLISELHRHVAVPDSFNGAQRVKNADHHSGFEQLIAATRLLALIHILLFWFAGGLATAQNPLSPFCVVPVQGGLPTEKDANQAWRMVSKVIALPEVPRPIIYAFNRGGAWTIDENRAFVPFGGEFPSNPIHDKIARDPNNGRLVGANSFLGVFALDPGETQFRKLHGLNGASPPRPFSVEFIPRFNAFVISDSTGLYLLDHDGRFSPLDIADRVILRTPASKVFDLPAFGALVVGAQNSSVVVRYDDGEVVGVATLDRFDFVKGISVETDGRVSIRGYRKSYTVRLSRTPVKPLDQGSSFVIGEIPLHRSRARLDAPSIGKTLVMNRRSGLTEIGHAGSVPLAIPFDPAQEPIHSIVEIPEYRAVFIVTEASTYALDASGVITEVQGARDSGTSRLDAIVRLIPVRKETIFLGRNSLNLLLDKRISGEDACRNRP